MQFIVVQNKADLADTVWPVRFDLYPLPWPFVAFMKNPLQIRTQAQLFSAESQRPLWRDFQNKPCKVT